MTSLLPRTAARRAEALLDDRDAWTVDAACRGLEPDALFVQGSAQNEAKALCTECPVRAECLADALDNRVEFGVWGGMTERERRALLRRRPEVTDWRRLLTDARRRHEAGERVPSPLRAA